jgi:hypothetical protein
MINSNINNDVIFTIPLLTEEEVCNYLRNLDAQSSTKQTDLAAPIFLFLYSQSIWTKSNHAKASHFSRHYAGLSWHERRNLRLSQNSKDVSQSNSSIVDQCV